MTETLYELSLKVSEAIGAVCTQWVIGKEAEGSVACDKSDGYNAFNSRAQAQGYLDKRRADLPSGSRWDEYEVWACKDFPHFASDLNLAYGLITKAGATGWKYVLDNTDTNTHCCTFQRGSEIVSASTGSLPEAICTAFLKTIGI